VEEFVTMKLTELNQLQLGSDRLALNASLQNRMNDLVAATITDKKALLEQDSCGEVDIWGLQEKVS
jgi:predicted secreted protein